MNYNIPQIKTEFLMSYSMHKINIASVEEEIKIDINTEFNIPYRIRMINMNSTQFEECILEKMSRNQEEKPN